VANMQKPALASSLTACCCATHGCPSSRFWDLGLHELGVQKHTVRNRVLTAEFPKQARLINGSRGLSKQSTSGSDRRSEDMAECNCEASLFQYCTKECREQVNIAHLIEPALCAIATGPFLYRNNQEETNLRDETRTRFLAQNAFYPFAFSVTCGPGALVALLTLTAHISNWRVSCGSRSQRARLFLLCVRAEDHQGHLAIDCARYSACVHWRPDHMRWSS